MKIIIHRRFDPKAKYPVHTVWFRVQRIALPDLTSSDFVIEPRELKSLYKIVEQDFERLIKGESLNDKIVEARYQFERSYRDAPTNMVIHEVDFKRDLLTKTHIDIDMSKPLNYYGMNVILAISGIERGTVKVF